ncbi:MAG: four helix bundle protein [Planctomycetota bacterium]|jgi:four helix bundle protein
MTENISFNFEKLTVYQKSPDAADWVYESTTTFPKNEIYGVTSQFRRAVVSIALNIAEGSARSKKDFRRLLDIAQGSVLECVALIEICKRRNYLEESAVLRLRGIFSEISKMISGLKRGIGFSERDTPQ